MIKGLQGLRGSFEIFQNLKKHIEDHPEAPRCLVTAHV
jgi:hypothetical protein